MRDLEKNEILNVTGGAICGCWQYGTVLPIDVSQISSEDECKAYCCVTQKYPNAASIDQYSWGLFGKTGNCQK